MTGTRSVEFPFEHVTAELAAIPMSSDVALRTSLVQLDPDMTDVETGQLWRGAENELVGQFPSYSIDELVAIRDWLWFQTARQHRPGRGETVALDEYLQRVAAHTLEFQGNVFRPRVPPWVEETSRKLSGSSDARARRFWRWVSFALPPDLLMAAHPSADQRAASVDLISPLLSQMLSDRRFVEPHMHIGAALEFELLWVAALHALADPTVIQHDSFVSPGAGEREGAGLSHWLVHAAIARYILAGFLGQRRGCPALSFDEYLMELVLPLCSPLDRLDPRKPNGPTDRSGKAATLEWRLQARTAAGGYAAAGLGHRILMCLRNLATGSINHDSFSLLQVTYAEITGIRRRWPKFPSRVKEAHDADPVKAALNDAASTGRSAEMDWVAAGLEYLAHLRRGKRTDQSFARLFWQVIRVRCRFYRHVVQRPMTPGLQWFVRFYSRTTKVRKLFSHTLSMESAVRVCGLEQGLQSLEFRTSPADTSEGTILLVRDFYKAILDVTGHAQPTRRSERHPSVLSRKHSGLEQGESIKTSPAEVLRLDATTVERKPEFGLVLHFSRDRGGGYATGMPTASSRKSAADPSWKGNAGYRYADFYRARRRQARSFARLFEQYPRSLFFVRGIDLCTDEVGIPTWTVAPLIRYVREVAQAASRSLSARPDEERPPPLRTTVHAGEDFVHLLGGLRRVDEAIEYLGLHQGDRIGHGIALGTDPVEWAVRSGGLAITKMERLLDLAWEWSFSTSHDVDVPASRVQYVMDQIERLSRDVFSQFAHPRQVAEFTRLLRDERELRRVGFPNGPIPNMEAYLKSVETLIGNATVERGEEAEIHDGRSSQEGQPGARSSSSESYWRERARRERARRERDSYGHADEPWRLLYSYLIEPSTFRRGQEQELVDPAFEAESLLALQTALRRKVGSSGITVEINPSSNLLIGNLSDLQRHPLWRLRPPVPDGKVGPIAVCIGSDNPITFSTSTREEYQIVYDTLTLAGLSDVDARRWIEDARESGLESRFTLPLTKSYDYLFRRIHVDIDHIRPLP